MLPRPPPNRLKGLDLLHCDLQRMCHDLIGHALDSQMCRQMAMNVHFALNRSHVETDTIFQTLMQYEGHILTPDWCNLVTRQIVARAGEMSEPLQLFDHPIRDEWVAIEVRKARECTWRESDRGVMLDFYCLTGHPAGHTLAKKFPERWLAWLAYRIGYSRQIPYDYVPEQMIGLRMWAFMLADRNGRNELDFEDWRVDPTMRAYNQLILKRRMRFEVDLLSMSESRAEKWSCPRQYEHYCSECQQTDSECCASYHRGCI